MKAFVIYDKLDLFTELLVYIYQACLSCTGYISDVWIFASNMDQQIHQDGVHRCSSTILPHGWDSKKKS